MFIIQAIDKFMLYVQIEKNYSPITCNSYLKDLLMFNEFVKEFRKDQELATITYATVRRYIQFQLKMKNKSPKSVTRSFSALRTFMKFCVRERYITENFMHLVEMHKTVSRLPI